MTAAYSTFPATMPIRSFFGTTPTPKEREIHPIPSTPAPCSSHSKTGSTDLKASPWRARGNTSSAYCSGTDRKLYVDGILKATGTGVDTGITQNGNDLRIGGWDVSGAFDFNGLIDDVRLYGVALSDAEVSEIYNNDDSPIIIGPATASSNTGKPYSFTYTVQDGNAAFPPTWSASGLPAGLGFNVVTGVLSGTPTGTPDNNGTTTNATITATSGYGASSVPLAFTLYPLPHSVSAGITTDLGLYEAKLNGSFADDTNTTCSVTAYVDLTDKGTSDPSAWTYSFPLGTTLPGTFSRQISALTFNTTYVFRFAASNIGGGLAWSGPGSRSAPCPGYPHRTWVASTLPASLQQRPS